MTIKLSLKDITKKKIEQQTSKDIDTSSLNDEKNQVKVEENTTKNETPNKKITLNLNKNISLNSQKPIEEEKKEIETQVETKKEEIKTENQNVNLDTNNIKVDNTKEKVEEDDIKLTENYEDITSKVEIKKSEGINKGELFSNYKSDFENLIKKEENNKNDKSDIKDKVVKKSRKLYIISSFSIVALLITLSLSFYSQDIKNIFLNGNKVVEEPILIPENNLPIDNEQEFNSPIDNENNTTVDYNQNGTGSIIDENTNNNPIFNENEIQKEEIKKITNDKILEIYLKKTINK